MEPRRKMDMSEVRDKLVYIFENLFNYRDSEDEQHTHTVMNTMLD